MHDNSVIILKMLSWRVTHRVIFRFLSNHACMNRGSTTGKNMKYIMWKYAVPPKMCRGTYVAIYRLITKRYNNNIKRMSV